MLWEWGLMHPRALWQELLRSIKLLLQWANTDEEIQECENILFENTYGWAGAIRRWGNTQRQPSDSLFRRESRLIHNITPRKVEEKQQLLQFWVQWRAFRLQIPGQQVKIHQSLHNQTLKLKSADSEKRRIGLDSILCNQRYRVGRIAVFRLRWRWRAGKTSRGQIPIYKS